MHVLIKLQLNFASILGHLSSIHKYTIRTMNKIDEPLEWINKIGAIEEISHMKAD